MLCTLKCLPSHLVPSESEQSFGLMSLGPRKSTTRAVVVVVEWSQPSWRVSCAHLLGLRVQKAHMAKCQEQYSLASLRDFYVTSLSVLLVGVGNVMSMLTVTLLITSVSLSWLPLNSVYKTPLIIVEEYS